MTPGFMVSYCISDAIVDGICCMLYNLSDGLHSLWPTEEIVFMTFLLPRTRPQKPLHWLANAMILTIYRDLLELVLSIMIC